MGRGGVRGAVARALAALERAVYPPPPPRFAPDREDAALASFPRSGNTWMRVLIAELLYGGSGESLAELDRYVPDVHAPPRARDVIAAEHHVVKTHFANVQTRQTLPFRRVVYLVRDPRDVVLSHFRYQSQLGIYEGSFDRFLDDWLHGRRWPCSWREHVDSWTGTTGEAPSGVLVVRYEDLVADPRGELARVADHLAITADEATLERSVRAATVERMRDKERRGMRPAERAEGFEFIGRATPGGWTERLTGRQEALIVERARPAMARHGYLERG